MVLCPFATHLIGKKKKSLDPYFIFTKKSIPVGLKIKKQKARYFFFKELEEHTESFYDERVNISKGDTRYPICKEKV